MRTSTIKSNVTQILESLNLGWLLCNLVIYRMPESYLCTIKRQCIMRMHVHLTSFRIMGLRVLWKFEHFALFLSSLKHILHILCLKLPFQNLLRWSTVWMWSSCPTFQRLVCCHEQCGHVLYLKSKALGAQYPVISKNHYRKGQSSKSALLNSQHSQILAINAWKALQGRCNKS